MVKIEFEMGRGTKVIIFLALLIITVVSLYSHYNSKVYEADQAKEWLSRARATNDLNDMAKYLNKTETLLESYHGNPAIIFPTPDTDYDQIRESVKECRNNALKWSSQNGTSMAYQQAVRNLQETINEIYLHLSDTNGALMWNWLINSSLIPLVLLTIISCVWAAWP